MDKYDHNKKVKRSIIFANIASILMAIIKLIFGFVTGSLSVLASAIDSIVDFFVSGFNYFIVKKSEDKGNQNYNYGFGKLQGIGAVLEGLMIGISGLALIYLSIYRLMNKGQIELVDESIFIVSVSIIILCILVFYMSMVARENNHLTLRSDLLHYKTDLLANIGIVISLIIIKFTQIYIIDTLIPILIGVYKIYASKDIIIEGFNMLLDKKIDDELIDKIKGVITNLDDKIFHYTNLKTRKSGNHNFIAFSLIFDKNIKLEQADEIKNKIKNQIHKNIFNSIICIDISTK